MGGGVWCLGFILLLIISLNGAAGLEINEVKISEVMYNPAGSDNNQEFVELFFETPTNLTGWRIADSTSEDVLVPLMLREGIYVIIVEEGYNYSGMNSSVYSVGATIGNNLGNEADLIQIINPEGEIMASLSYNSSLGGNGNGKSICLFNNSWQECIATPGRENVGLANEESGNDEESEESEGQIEEELKLSVYLDSEVYLNQEYTQLFRIEIEEKLNCSIKDNVTVLYRVIRSNLTTTGSSMNSSLIKEDTFIRELGCSAYSSTGEFVPLYSGNYSLCGEVISSTLDKITGTVCKNFSVIDTSEVFCNLSINISTNKTRTYREGESIKFTPNLNEETFPFIIEYWIEDLFGLIYKAKINTTNTNQKSWKTDIEEEDRVLLIKARVYPTCIDSNITDNSAEEIFFVMDDLKNNINNLNNLTGLSTLTIEELNLGSNEIGEWGSQFTAKIKVYKGDTSKYSIQLWAEKDDKKISSITKFNVYDKYTEYSLTLPVLLESNCDTKIDDGEAVIVLEGLGLKDEEEFTIEGINTNVCENIESSEVDVREEKTSSVIEAYKIVELPASVSSGEILRVKVQLIGDDSEHEYSIWSYLYRGSKCYSCLEGKAERENNLQQVQVKEDEVKMVDFLMKLDSEMKEGEYKLKVKLNKDAQKTEQELTEDIYVTAAEIVLSQEERLISAAAAEEFNEGKIDVSTREISKQTMGIVVYESSPEKAKQLIPYLLVITFILMVVVVIKNK